MTSAARSLVLTLAGVATCSLLVLAQPRPPAPDAPRFPLRTEPRVYEWFRQKVRVSVVAHGIERPWSLLPLPNGDFLVSVRASGQVRAIRNGGQNTINDAGQQIVRRQLNVAPTLTIRPGFPVRIIVTRDLVFEPAGG